MADKLAKRGAAAPQFSPKISLQTCKQILRNNYRQEWLQQWASSKTGRSLYEYQQKPNPMDPLRQLERANQSLTFQLRTGHVPVNKHLNRINPLHEPNCRHCNAQEETVEHLLLQCPKLIDIQQELLPPLPTIHNTLYTTAPQLRKTCAFARRAMGCQELLAHCERDSIIIIISSSPSSFCNQIIAGSNLCQ